MLSDIFIIEKYSYYSRFKGKKAAGVATDLEENSNIMMYAQQVAQVYRQEALMKTIQPKIEAVLGKQPMPQMGQ